MDALLARQRAQPLDRARKRELGAAEALDEVPAAGGAEDLEVGELAVERREAAGDPLREHGLAGHDPVALEHQLGLGAQARAARRSVAEQLGDQRPAALHGDRGSAAARGEAPHAPALGAGRGLQPRSAQRREGVVGDLARPGEIPERGVQLLALVALEGEGDVEPEGRAGR